MKNEYYPKSSEIRLLHNKVKKRNRSQVFKGFAKSSYKLYINFLYFTFGIIKNKILKINQTYNDLQKLLLFLHFSLIISVQVDLSKQCTCKQYENDVCDLDPHCSQNSNECGNIICSNKSKDFCTGINTNFKCEYDQTSNTCKDKKSTCNDLGEQYCSYSLLFGMNCVWSVNEKCEDLDCTIAKDCPLEYCAYQNKICSAPKNKIDCSTISYSQCNGIADGLGQICKYDNENQCESYDAKIDCQEWNDQPLLSCMLIGCGYEGSKCRDPICSDIKSQGSCAFIYNRKQNLINVCKWNGKQCSDASEADISQFSLIECVLNTYYTYTWSGNKCIKCSDSQNSNSSTNSSNNQSGNNSDNQNGNNSNVQTNIVSKINVDYQQEIQLDIQIGSLEYVLMFPTIIFAFI